ncbi:MAG: EAL domain-containing protein [Eubacteriales bacterium]
MNQHDLDIMLKHIQCIATNVPIKVQELESDDETLQDIQEGLIYISQSLCAFHVFARNICKGDLDVSMPTRDNFLAGSLKELHSVLKHLTWQTKQVASGDYGQRVSFLGEFSEAFNIMVSQLHDREIQLSQQSLEQAEFIEILTSILDSHTDWILVTDKTSNDIIYNNKEQKLTLNHFERNYKKVFTSPVLVNHIKNTIENGKITNLTYHHRDTKNFYSINSYPMHWKGQEALVHYISDITNEQLEREALSNIAYLDSLTGSYNRHYCMNEINELILEQLPFSLVMVDLNDLKVANDKFGHSVGDEYICTVVDVLKRQTRDIDDVCRVGGDEFILLLRECPLEVAHHKMEEIFEEIESIHRQYKLSISYGITYVDEWQWNSIEDILKISDEHMYAFKKQYKQRQLDESDTMKTVQLLYSNIEDFEYKVHYIDTEKDCLLQIFTANLSDLESVALAQELQTILPKANIIGTSANVIIYDGEQYSDETLIVVEQYQHSTIYADIIEWPNKSPQELVGELKAQFPDALPSLIRVLISGHYDDTYYFLEEYNEQLPNIAIAGGLASGQHELLTPPFLFNTKCFVHRALSYVGIVGDRISDFSRVNTSTEIVTTSYTINETSDREILTIENEPATDWLQKNLGFDHTATYVDFDDNIMNDPFIRLQIVLENRNNSNRVLFYNHETQHISQYFTKLPPNTKFHIGYASPTKCVEECKKICLDIQHKPVEFLFVYSCLVRKLYLNNCSNWELAPYNNTNVCGTFLLGEFGYQDNSANVYNGSCVLMGVAESPNYLQLNMTAFEELDRIQEQQESLLDFVKNRKNKEVTAQVEQLLDDIVTHEKANQETLYYDTSLQMYNIVKYEKDHMEFDFSRLCLVKIINSELLMSYLGRTTYLAQLNMLLTALTDDFLFRHTFTATLHTYSLSHDTIIIATDNAISSDDFLRFMSELEVHFKSVQYDLGIHPFIARFVMVNDHPNLLDQAYSQLQLHYSTQDHFIIGNSSLDNNMIAKKEIEVINSINYAITHNQVIPYYQGIYNNHIKEIDKYEALMRIQDKDGNLLLPNDFLDIAKKYRLYLTLTKKMIDLVLKDFYNSDYTVSINISSLDIASHDIRMFLQDRILKFPHPSRLVFEILEDECFKDTTELKDFVAEIKHYGSKVAVDDFGSGYSNLLELIKIKPDFIKVDGQIIKDIHNNHDNEIIIGTISSMAQQLSVELVAEFVETLEIQNAVVAHGIDYSQGYFFSTPHPISKIPSRKVVSYGNEI